MKVHSNHPGSNRVIVLSALLLSFAVFAIWMVSLSGQAKASSLQKPDKPLPEAVATGPVPTVQLTPNPTGTPGVPTPQPTGTLPCVMTFSDVAASDWFYGHVRWAFCRAIAGGYNDGTFRPYNNSTRAQIAKMVVLASGWPLISPPQPTFSDVELGSPFYVYIETAAQRGIIGGYADGTFRPGNDVTRGQLCKMTVLARGWALLTPQRPTFTDVPVGSTFYSYVETAASRNVVGGYDDGTFRPGNNATRAQLSKILQNVYSQP